jgi:hypothetical protein
MSCSGLYTRAALQAGHYPTRQCSKSRKQPGRHKGATEPHAAPDCPKGMPSIQRLQAASGKLAALCASMRRNITWKLAMPAPRLPGTAAPACTEICSNRNPTRAPLGTTPTPANLGGATKLPACSVFRSRLSRLNSHSGDSACGRTGDLSPKMCRSGVCKENCGSVRSCVRASASSAFLSKQMGRTTP